MSPRTIAAALFLCLLAAATVDAQQQFRAVVSGRSIYGCFILPITFDVIEWIDPDSSDSSTNVEMVASGDHRNVFALLEGNATRVVRIQPDGSTTPFFEDLTGNALSLAVNAAGRVFVIEHSGPDFRVRVISPAGVSEALYPLPDAGFPSSLTVANDGCTLFYLSSIGTIRRINGCTGAVLPDLVPVGSASIQDIDILSNGQVLLAANQSLNLHDASGAFIRTIGTLPGYGFPDDFVGQAEVTDDLSQVCFTVSGCDSQSVLLTASFFNGAELSRREIEVNTPNGLVLGAGLTAGVPLSRTALLILAIGIAMVAAFRISVT